MKYVYPALFTKEENGYSVCFPDIEGCFTCGESLPEAMEMAEDALCLMLYDHEEDGEIIPPASDVSEIQVNPQSFVSLIHCDTLKYRKLYNNKAVKKTLSIPMWLNTLAEQEDINFSAVLQNALKTQLNIE